MKKTAVLPLILAAFSLCLLSGCGSEGEKNPGQGDVNKAFKGMSAITVEKTVGKPGRVAESVDGKPFYQDWYYDTGMICFYRHEVINVIPLKDMPPQPENRSKDSLSQTGIYWPSQKDRP